MGGLAPVRVEVDNGMPGVYVPRAVIDKFYGAEKVKRRQAKTRHPQFSQQSEVKLVQAHQLDTIQPQASVINDLYVEDRFTRALLPPGVAVGDDTSGVGRDPHLDSWFPPIGTSLKVVRRVVLSDACVHDAGNGIDQHFVYLPRPGKTLLLCKNDDHCEYIKQGILKRPEFSDLVTQPYVESQNSRPVIHLTYDMLYKGLYHIMVEALPAIVPHLSALRDGSMQVFAHRGQNFLTPILAKLGVLGSALLYDAASQSQAFTLCAPTVHLELRPDFHPCPQSLRRLQREFQRLGEFQGRRENKSIVVLSRGNSTRSLSNEGELVLALRDLGRPVEVLEPSPDNLQDVVLALSQAEVVVGAHGANLVNLLFASPGTKVVEIMPQVPFHFVSNHYRNMAAALGLIYEPVGQAVEHYDAFLALSKINQSQAIASYAVDTARVKQSVAELLDDASF